jgi:hypothetical protein
LYWGEAWVQRCHNDLDVAWNHLEEARRIRDASARVATVEKEEPEVIKEKKT